METSGAIEAHPPPPRIQIDRLHLGPKRAIYVVRDDLLPAGTKQRAVIPLLLDLRNQGARHLTYASPFAGFAQVALAYGCHALKIPCTLYCEQDPRQPGMQPHPFTKLAGEWGAKVILVEDLNEGERLAAELAHNRAVHKIPLGFQCREFQAHFQEAVTSSLLDILSQLGSFPARTWLPIGSGTLAHAFHKATPKDMQLCCVNVHVLPESDPRIQSLRALPRVKYFSAKEEFREPAAQPPPLPSNMHYDAKLWAVLQEFAEDGDLWWNVAR